MTEKENWKDEQCVNCNAFFEMPALSGLPANCGQCRDSRHLLPLMTPQGPQVLFTFGNVQKNDPACRKFSPRPIVLNGST